jgi:hypothetical protein
MKDVNTVAEPLWRLTEKKDVPWETEHTDFEAVKKS